VIAAAQVVRDALAMRHSPIRCRSWWGLLLLLGCGSLAQISSEESASADWLPAIAALTDSRSVVYEPAMEALIRHGSAALPDVATLATDAHWEVRARVATVAAGVGGADAAALLIAMSGDPDMRVRTVVAAGLGKTPGEQVFATLARMLRDIDPNVQVSAIDALGNLGDPQGLLELAKISDSAPAALRTHRSAALQRLANRPDMVMSAAEAIGASADAVRRNVIEAVSGIGDPRLTPALVRALQSGDDILAGRAAKALATNGDARSLESLCALAADSRRIHPARIAAETLTAMTGVEAAAGATWALWWRENSEAVTALIPRDLLLANLHDLDHPVTRADLAQFTPEQLMPLIDGLLGEGAWWWHQRAGRVLLVDNPARWTPILLRRIERTLNGEERLALIILLDQYGDPGAANGLKALLAKRPAVAGRNDPERVALQIALERRKK
jgi:HEAT repeat protein